MIPSKRHKFAKVNNIVTHDQSEKSIDTAIRSEKFEKSSLKTATATYLQQKKEKGTI